MRGAARGSRSRLARPRSSHWVTLGTALLLAIGACRDGGAAGALPEAHVEIRGKPIAVEVADSRSEQQKGLGERDGLAWDSGMYFPYQTPGFYSFWMKGMRFSIDIVFVREGRIVEIHPQVPFEQGGNGPTIRPRSLVDGVLEVPAGYAVASGWQIGDRVRFERVNAD
jgi:uncharacterized membrane protein (UPF0127 family)